MHPISSVVQLASLGDDPLLRWAAQGFRAGVRAWREGAGVAIAAPDLARRNRFVVAGTPDDVASIVETALTRGPHEFRPLGDADLVAELGARLPWLAPGRPFGWMHARQVPGGAVGANRGRGVAARVELATPDDAAAIEALLADALPNSLARPGVAGVRRWWVVRDGSAVRSCAADAWSAPGVGLLAGVATATGQRGLGLGRSVVDRALQALVDDYGSVGLMVDDDNTAARRLYESFGMSYRQIRGASVLPA